MTSAGIDMKCFKAYDIRGRVPEDLNEDVAYRIGRAYAQFIKPETVAVGMDIRHHSPMLAKALMEGLTDGGADVIDIGLCGTEEIYFSVFHNGYSGGIMVTASHNPMDYNGMKLVREGSKPVSGDTGLNDIRDLAAANNFPAGTKKGSITKKYDKTAYIDYLMRYVDTDAVKGMKLVLNAGNGCAGPVADLLEKRIPAQFIKVFNEPDGTFPNGIPNPLLPENRQPTEDAVIKNGADIGIAWDGDFDRCFLFDEKGGFIEGYYIVALLAEAMLAEHPGEKIIHDPRLTWNTIDVVRRSGGDPVMSKTGHAYIKERMRKENAIYGGEMSAHHYFRDFAFCDSGMIPWLLVITLMAKKKKTLSVLVEEMIEAYPVSGELNVTIETPEKVIKAVEAKFASEALEVDHTDGVSMILDGWRFNLRMSNTEPLVRLNVETKGNYGLMCEKRDLLLDMLDSSRPGYKPVI